MTTRRVSTGEGRQRSLSQGPCMCGHSRSLNHASKRCTDYTKLIWCTGKKQVHFWRSLISFQIFDILCSSAYYRPTNLLNRSVYRCRSGWSHMQLVHMELKALQTRYFIITSWSFKKIWQVWQQPLFNFTETFFCTGMCVCLSDILCFQCYTLSHFWNLFWNHFGLKFKIYLNLWQVIKNVK